MLGVSRERLANPDHGLPDRRADIPELVLESGNLESKIDRFERNSAAVILTGTVEHNSVARVPRRAGQMAWTNFDLACIVLP
jgi:hypothetical protein